VKGTKSTPKLKGKGYAKGGLVPVPKRKKPRSSTVGGTMDPAMKPLKTGKLF
jgi:hypothetical protein